MGVLVDRSMASSGNHRGLVWVAGAWCVVALAAVVLLALCVKKSKKKPQPAADPESLLMLTRKRSPSKDDSLLSGQSAHISSTLPEVLARRPSLSFGNGLLDPADMQEEPSELGSSSLSSASSSSYASHVGSAVNSPNTANDGTSTNNNNNGSSGSNGARRGSEAGRGAILALQVLAGLQQEKHVHDRARAVDQQQQHIHAAAQLEQQQLDLYLKEQHRKEQEEQERQQQLRKAQERELKERHAKEERMRQEIEEKKAELLRRTAEYQQEKEAQLQVRQATEDRVKELHEQIEQLQQQLHEGNKAGGAVAATADEADGGASPSGDGASASGDGAAVGGGGDVGEAGEVGNGATTDNGTGHAAVTNDASDVAAAVGLSASAAAPTAAFVGETTGETTGETVEGNAPAPANTHDDATSSSVSPLPPPSSISPDRTSLGPDSIAFFSSSELQSFSLPFHTTEDLTSMGSSVDPTPPPSPFKQWMMLPDILMPRSDPVQGEASPAPISFGVDGTAVSFFDGVSGGGGESLRGHTRTDSVEGVI